MPSPLVKRINSQPMLTRDQLSERNPFVIRTDSFNSSKLSKRLLSRLVPLVEKILGLDVLAQGYEQLPHDLDGRDFLCAVLGVLRIDYHIPTRAVENIPATGPVVVVANHPFGGLEGMVLTELVTHVRSDSRVLVNTVLGRLKELSSFFICVDPFGGTKAARANIQPLKAAIRWVQNGGLLATFPSGTVSHFHWRRLEVTDPPWSLNTATIIRRSKATVVPVYFHGRNSIFFQILGFIHPLLRTIRLPRELMAKYGARVPFEVGYPIPWSRLAEFKTDEELLSYIRLRTFILKNRPVEESKPTRAKQFAKKRPASRDFEPIVAPPPHAQLVNEIAQLPQQQILVENNDFAVYFAYASQIPCVLQEIGRLREITFRQADEGTGKSIDLDRFDNYYVHLFSWCKSAREIVGAYRIGRADSILERYGLDGLYTGTLFHYSHALLDQLGPSLELGRSFVRVEYQRNYWSLLFLWKGIGHFVARNPQYRNLFGPVSINNNYDSVSRHLIRVFLEQNNYSPELARLVKPRNAPPETTILGIDRADISTVVRDLKDVSHLLSDLEARPEVVPVLLRQYLKLGGRLLGFNVDPDFGDVLDGLVLVDLIETEPKMLVKYMGADGLRSFFEYHGKSLTSRDYQSA